MAKGYPDYWQPERLAIPVPIIGQEPYFIMGRDLIDAGGNAFLISDTADDDEVIYVAGGMVSCDFPVLQKFRLLWNSGDETSWDIYFDVQSLLPLNPSAMIEVPSGDFWQIKAYNLDTIAHNFYAVAFGIKIKVVAAGTTPRGGGIGIRQADI